MILAVLCVFFNHIHCHQTCWNSNLSSVRHLAPFGISQCHLKHLLLTHQTVWKWKEQQLNINWLQFPKATIEEEEAKCEEKETEKPKAEAAHNPLLILHLVTTSARQVSGWHCGNCLSASLAVWHLTHLLPRQTVEHMCDSSLAQENKGLRVVELGAEVGETSVLALVRKQPPQNFYFDVKSVRSAPHFWLACHYCLGKVEKWESNWFLADSLPHLLTMAGSLLGPGQHTRFRLTACWSGRGMGKKRMEAINKITTLCKINCVLCKRLANGRICINVHCWSP